MRLHSTKLCIWHACLVQQRRRQTAFDGWILSLSLFPLLLRRFLALEARGFADESKSRKLKILPAVLLEKEQLSFYVHVRGECTTR
jgi:hypothetical protein